MSSSRSGASAQPLADKLLWTGEQINRTAFDLSKQIRVQPFGGGEREIRAALTAMRDFYEAALAAATAETQRATSGTGARADAAIEWANEQVAAKDEDIQPTADACNDWCNLVGEKNRQLMELIAGYDTQVRELSAQLGHCLNALNSAPDEEDEA